MNIVNKLTIRHLKQNKRRTLVTMIGVIISVAMLTAVATLAVSFLDLMKKQSIAEDGEWHILYEDVNKKQLEAIKNDEATKELIISKDLGYAYLEGSQNDDKPYLFVKEYNAQGFENFQVELSEGRFPQTANEIVISDEIATDSKVIYEIGDTLTLDIGERFWIETDEPLLSQSNPLEIENDEMLETIKSERTENYTIVGTIKRPIFEYEWEPWSTVIAYVDESLIIEDDTVNAAVTVKKVNNALLTHAANLATKNKIEFYRDNYNLLRYYGVASNDHTRTMFFSLAAIIMSIIIIGSVSLIYNAFAISVSERARHLGMLSSVGATNRQKKKSVFFEGAIIGLISIPLGIISGLIGIGITFYFINKILQEALGLAVGLTLTVTPFSILTAIVVSILTIYISTYIPAKRASKISAIDAIRQTEDVKLTKKAVKTSKIVRKLFGMEAEIGLKNLKRNKRRYQATVFSLVISIVLFLSVTSFTSNLKKSLGLTQDGINYDISLLMDNEDAEIDAQLMEEIINLDDVTEHSVLKSTGLFSWIDEASITNELRDRDMVKNNGKYLYFTIIHSLDDESLKSYAKEIGANYEALTDPKKLSAIVVDTFSYQDEETAKFVETKAIHTKVGKSLDFHYEDPETEEDIFLNKVEVGALTGQLPMGINSTAGMGSVDIIVSELIFDKLVVNREGINTLTELVLKSNDPMATHEEIEEMTEDDIYVQDAYKRRQTDEQMIVLMSVFTYGFIALITAISIANIFNTISTSIALRKREFAMLKSVGMTPKGFNKMINYESIFYGIKSLLYGLPISIIVMYLIHRSIMNRFDYAFEIPWLGIVYVIVAIFLIVSSAMLYASSKVKKENIIDALKQESI